MENLVVLVVLSFALKGLSQGIPSYPTTVQPKPDTYDWLSIDCGSLTKTTTASGILWQTDEKFTKAGTNKLVSTDNFNSSGILNSLRAFTQQNKNCYNLPTTASSRYFLRAAFYYGNHDGLSNPPTFDLEIDENKWTTVVSSLVAPVYYEVIYASKGDNIFVCLAQTVANQFPFISSLEAWPIPDTMYNHMDRNLAWLNSYRYNYGTKDLILGYPEDSYNRIWIPAIPSGMVAKIANTTTLTYTTDEQPPDTAILNAIEAQELINSISLPFNMSKKNSLYYIEAYFTGMYIDDTRSFDIYVNDNYVTTTSPEFENCTGAWTTTNNHTGSLTTVELRPTAESTLPPIISAIELYTASDPLVTTGTSQDDCYGLEGPLPDFRQMTGLETIKLDDNDFSGYIPRTIVDNKNITFNVTGNPKLRHPKKENKALTSVVVVILVVVAGVYFIKRHQACKVKVTKPGLNGQLNSHEDNASTAHLRPNPPPVSPVAPTIPLRRPNQQQNPPNPPLAASAGNTDPTAQASSHSRPSHRQEDIPISGNATEIK
ncbi:hypothetical protein RJ639_012607 [Escallonia herrerae]|uniref:Malectin-like domain-containing protein n=1 Tax=Escallonia herrerae TaxID=1293975 RepID=A0AA88VMI8_9ASTE|nr:hypothetical protein RJ639_012607 [Escallonia herrerae]